MEKALTALAGCLSCLGHCLDTPKLWVHPPSGHKGASTDEYVNGWNNKSKSLSLSLCLSLFLLPSLSLKSMNNFFFNFRKSINLLSSRSSHGILGKKYFIASQMCHIIFHFCTFTINAIPSIVMGSLFSSLSIFYSVMSFWLKFHFLHNAFPEDFSLEAMAPSWNFYHSFWQLIISCLAPAPPLFLKQGAAKRGAPRRDM